MSMIRSGLVALPRLLGGVRPLGWAADAMRELRRRHRTRRQFQALSDHMCRDIGISRAALHEARKPLWRL